jgi:uncharacterized membrane protein YhaH (DUF805 family)
MKYFLKALQNYANFNGRARRSEYWYFALFNFLIGIVLTIIDIALFGEDIQIISLIFNLGMFVPTLAVAVRRMHDTGHSGWYILIPIYNLVLACTDGDSGSNGYGEDPKTSEGQMPAGDLLDAHM